MRMLFAYRKLVILDATQERRRVVKPLRKPAGVLKAAVKMHEKRSDPSR